MVRLRPDVYEAVRVEAFQSRRTILAVIDEVLRRKFVPKAKQEAA